MKQLLLTFLICLTWSLNAQDKVYTFFLATEYKEALKELNSTDDLDQEQILFLKNLIKIWNNNGSQPIEDSLLVSDISNKPSSPKDLLLLGSYYLFNGKRNEALPVFLEIMRMKKNERDDNVTFISILGILNIYSKMYAIGRDYKDYIDLLQEYSNGSSIKYAWFLIYRMKFNGAQAPSDSSLAIYFDWQNRAHEFYQQNMLSDGLSAHFEYQFGSAAKFRKEYSTAEKYFHKVIESGQNLPYLRHTVFNAHLQLAGILSSTNQYSLARKYYNDALQYGNEIDPLLYRHNYNMAIALDYFEDTKQYDSAYIYLKENIGALIPMFIEENNLWVSELKESYDAIRREEELEQQKQRIASQNKLLILTAISVILLTALFGIAVFAFLRIRKKNNRIEWLMRELHHRVKNNLQIVSSLLGLQSMKLEDASAKKAVSEGKGRIRAMSLIHQRLYQNKEFTSLNMEEYLSELINELVLAYGGGETVKINMNIVEKKFNAETSLPIGLLVNEIVSNSLKHALPKVSKLELSISLVKTKSNKYQLRIRDNGPGIVDETSNTASFGLRLVDILVKQLNGSKEVSCENGVSYLIEFGSLNQI